MKPHREPLAEGIELWHGNALDVIPLLGPVDHAIFDPPYESHMHVAKAAASGSRARLGRRLRNDGARDPKPVRFASIDNLRPALTPMVVRACQGWLIAFCTPEGIAPWRDAIEAASARYKRACFFYKPDSTPQLNGQGPAFAVEPFVTAWCGSGVSRWNGGGRRNLFTHMTNQPDRDGTHETEKPVPLMAEIVTLFTNPGDLVLDPTMGSGTTGIACVRAGRRFVGVEMDRDYFRLSVRRISLALRQPDLFVHIPKPQKSRPML